MNKFITTAAVGALASAIVLQTGFAGADSSAAASGGPAPLAINPATAAELQSSCAFYTNLLSYADRAHFSGAVTVSQNTIAEGALQGVLAQIYQQKFTGAGALDQSQVQFVDPVKKEEIQSMTIGASTVTASPAPAAMASYADHCAYLNRAIAPLARETGTSIRRLYEYAVNGALSASRDPHTSYMWQEQFDEMRNQTRGEFGGLGIEVNMKDGAVQVVSPIQDTPASRAGLQANDLITAINGDPTNGKTLSEAVNLMRGAVGSDITLTIKRGDSTPFDVRLTREIIVVHAATGKLVGDNNDTAHIVVKTFSDKTTSDIIDAIDRIEREAANNNSQLRNIVLDFRNNPGGLLNQAEMVSDIFLASERGRIRDRIRAIELEQVQALAPAPRNVGRGIPTIDLLRDPDRFRAPADVLDQLKRSVSDPAIHAALERFRTLESERDQLTARLPHVEDGRIVAVGKTRNDDVTYVDTVMANTYEGYQITVLQNQGSASASEIVAGAMRDAGIDVIGTTSFGKGSVQSIIPIGPDGNRANMFGNVAGAIRLTTDAFFPGNTGLSNQGSGIIPTVEVRYNDVRDEIAATARREAELEHSLVSAEQTRAAERPNLTCSLKEEFAGALSPEELAAVPATLVREMYIRNDQSGEFEPVKMLDADLACALNRLTGSSPYTVISPYTPRPASPAPAP